MKYPGGIKQPVAKNINYGNRGTGLENDINITNQYYRDIKKAIIHKKPTPIQITKVNYKSRQEVIIKEAFFKAPSTTDYNGIYQGKYIDFEAKETKSNTSFPLTNIHTHQINHIKEVIEHGGISFLIIRFVQREQNFLLKGEDFISFLNENKRRSLPISFFMEKGYLISEKYNPRLDYLEVVDKIYFGGELNG
ncbi:MAG: Holliday junction resolvase RecU [Bacilli bacterium]|jgi:recombination protein U|nr:Holliday junction resolvase RecU [Bacilli bacterium]